MTNQPPEMGIALDDFESHLGNLRGQKLRNFSVNELPALHYLATVPSKPEDHIKLDRIIKRFKNAGCDLNQASEEYVTERGRAATLGFTPLLVAIEQKNLQFVECLLENGARSDISDTQGFLPLHWAIFVGDMGCFRKLIEAGALKAFSSEATGGEARPILHTAVDEGNTEMVKYLLEHQLVDVHQEAVYSGSHLSELRRRSSLEKLMSIAPWVRLNLQEPRKLALEDTFTEIVHSNVFMEPLSKRFTPLARAIRMRRQPMIEMLLKSGAKVSGISELHHCILQGEVEIACQLIGQFSHEDLTADKIENKWALHCLHPCAFRVESVAHETIELINAYVTAGWDVNSVGKSTTKIGVFGVGEVGAEFEITLLHLACYFESLEIIKHLVEAGADVNIGNRGKDILSPLQVSIFQEDWSSVEYLLANGADVHAVGGFKTVKNLEWVSEPGPRNVDLQCHFTSLELLLQLGCEEEGMAALEEMLEKGVPPPERIAFQRAVLGKSCKFVSKMVEHLCGVQNVKMEDLTWLPVTKEGGAMEYVPSLHWLLQNVFCRARRDDMAKVVDVMGRFGYDFTLKPRPATFTGRRNTEVVEEPLVFYILKIESVYPGESGLPLLEAILEFNKVEVNVRFSTRLNPVEYVIRRWRDRDIQRKTAAVGLLIRSGADMSGVVIGEGFRYYQGYLPMIQLMCSVGAKIEPDGFIPSVPENFQVGAQVAAVEAGDGDNALALAPVIREIDELKEWKKRFDNERKLTLKQICVVQIRKMLNTVGDLRMLKGELPEELTEEVVGQIYGF